LSNGYFHFVNLHQTPQERQGKYNLVISMGGTPALARRFRDCRLAKIERLFGLTTTNNKLPVQERLALYFPDPLKNPALIQRGGTT